MPNLRLKKILKYGLLALMLLFIAYAIYFYMAVKKNLTTQKALAEQAYHFPTYPKPNLTNKTNAEIAQIRQGAYLVKVGDCIACHTAEKKGSAPFAGGLRIQTAFGAIYSENITSDKKTGIGNWDNKDFIRAMREGISPKGSYYYPAFPYPYFNRITTPNLLAIKAYLDAIPPVQQANHPNDMLWPLNWRFMQLGWRLLFFHPKGPYQVNPSQSPNWNRGAYLTKGLGHCGLCHTPSYYVLTPALSLGAPIEQYALTGGLIDDYLAPNISAATLADIPDAKLLAVFKNAKSIDNAPVQGPMLEAIRDSLYHLSDQDLKNIIIYLKTVPDHRVKTQKVLANTRGQKIYIAHCSMCHAMGIAGAPRFGHPKTWARLKASGMNNLYQLAIHGNANMPAKGGCTKCSNKEVKAAVDYMVAKSIRTQ